MVLKVIIDQVVNLFIPKKVIDPQGRPDKQTDKNKKDIPKVPVIVNMQPGTVAQASVGVKTADLGDTTVNRGAGSMAWVGATDHAVKEVQNKDRVVRIKPKTFFKSGSRGRGRM